MGKRGPSKASKDAKRKLCENPGAMLEDVLGEEEIDQECHRLEYHWRKRIFTPLVSLWTFIAQVLQPDSSCRQGVARVLTDLAFTSGLEPSHDPSAYCRARQRLPDELLPALTRTVARDLDAKVEPGELWHGHKVRLVDGSSVSLWDCPENQKAYPQPTGQKPGCGFPVARIVGVFSLTTGALIDLAVAALSVGETILFHTIWCCLAAGDVLVGDRHFCSYAEIALFEARGVHVLFRLHQRRKPKDGRWKRLGRNDWLVRWPKGIRPRWMSRKEFDALPETLTLRVLTFECHVRGWRTKKITAVTTLLDPVMYPAKDVARLYQRRWEIETDLGHVKTTLGMDILSCRSPEMVRKEIWAYLLAYNLIRTLMWDAAVHCDVPVSRVSFKATVQELLASWPYGALAEDEEARRRYYDILLRRVATHKIPNRPNRSEPRVRKRRPKNYRLMTKPRHEYNKDLLGDA